ncbi:carbohydrate ABC transporter permease [Mycoplasma struthionis]|uniref:Sugar ABC transporter permease n=1 Tax=Mycoplasma struthionis TaxID=538220 RepID=A0A502M6W0_9MOLU|nr:sugar ABC transporter permease [Mycoplasma struthionis]TPI03084.1 sugar ABC transporter permease [Mycoplasma struthionis]
MRTYFWKKYRVKNPGLALSVLNTKVPFWKPFMLMLPSLITMGLFTIFPFIIVIITALKTQVGFAVDEVAYGLGNFKFIFQTNKVVFNVAVRTSLLYSVLSLPISLMISLLISAAISQVIKTWARSFWQTVFFLPYVTSGIAVSLAFAYIFKSDGGLINIILQKMNLIKKPIQFLDGSNNQFAPFMVILIRGIWGSLAFQILILTTAMLSVNPDLYKSASIDGASSTKQFFKITLPSINKTISFLFTMGIIGGIKTFPLALFNNSSQDAIAFNGASLMLYVYHWTISAQYGRAAAASIVLFLIGLIISFGLRRLVFLTFKLSNNLGERRVFRKIEGATLKGTTVFKS